MPSSSVPPCSSCVMLAQQESGAQDAVFDRDNIVTPALPILPTITFQLAERPPLALSNQLPRWTMVDPPPAQSNRKFPWPTGVPVAPGAGPPMHGPLWLTCCCTELANTPNPINGTSTLSASQTPLNTAQLRSEARRTALASDIRSTSAAMSANHGTNTVSKIPATFTPAP